MSRSDNLSEIAACSEADRIRESLDALRASVIEAWQTRAVMLTLDEQRALRDEIRETCALLMNLTGGETRNE